MTNNERAACTLDRAADEVSVRSQLIDQETISSRPGLDLPLNSYLAIREKLKHEAVYFPLGFPVRILSDSKRVLEAAENSWGSFTEMFHQSPLEFAVTVKPDGTHLSVLPASPTHALSGSLLSLRSDADNFSIADLRHGRAVARVTKTTVRYQNYFRYHILEGTVLSMLATLRCVPIHAACVRVGNKGILLCGDSGDGKSTLSFAGARAGWTYISDDATYLPIRRSDRLVLGNCHRVRFRPSAVALFPELAGRPVTPRAAGKPSIEVSTSEWPELAIATAAHIDHVVFLNRKCGDEQELISREPSSFRRWFRDNLLSTPETLDAQEAALSRLLTANVLELRFQDLSWAIRRIEQLAIEER